MANSIDEKIAEKQKELNALLKQKTLNREGAIKLLFEYTTEEKIQWFDSLYNSALGDLEFKEKSGKEYEWNEDDPHYAWEARMEILARNKKSFWEYYNSL